MTGYLILGLLIGSTVLLLTQIPGLVRDLLNEDPSYDPHLERARRMGWDGNGSLR